MISIQLILQLQDIAEQLLPEQRRAVTMMSDHLLDWENYLNDEVSLTQLCTKGEMFFTKKPLNTSALPRGREWQWNQSRSKNHLTIQDDLKISFCKLNTKKAKGYTKRSPAYKVWIFHLKFTKFFSTLHFAWCEKGELPTKNPPLTKSSVDTNTQTQNDYTTGQDPEPISIHELSFLQEFTDIYTAKQLGWI